MRQGWKKTMAMVLMFLCAVIMVQVLSAADVPEGAVIERIDVAGNVTLTRAEVLAAVRARPGQFFNEKTTTEDTERIARLDAAESAYYNIQVQDGKVILTYVVVERNLVRSITFKGNRKLSSQALQKELPLHQGDYLDVFAIRGGVDSLKEFYKKKGFPWAEIRIAPEDE